MPTSSKKELQQEIQDLKDALESEFTPAQFKDDIRKQIKDSEAELDKLEKAEKDVKTASAEKKPEKVEKKETAAQRVKKRVEQAKKTVKTAKKKQEEVKQEKKSALQKIKERKEKMASAKKPVRKSAPKKSSLSKKRDAERKALKPGRRVSADGNVYYENRSNRTDLQRRKYPYLEDGGTTDFTNEGAGMFAKGGIFGSDRNLSRDRMFKSQEDWEQRYKRKNRPKNPTYQKHEMGGELHKTQFAEGGVIVDYTEGLLADPRFDINSPMFARGGKLSNKYNYLPKYQIATITTEDGAVIDGNDIIDGVYVKKKVKF
jgi:hypothetical protein